METVCSVAFIIRLSDLSTRKEIAFQWGESSVRGESRSPGRELDWELLDISYHQGVHLCSQELNALYVQSPQLWQADHLPSSFRWVDFSDVRNGVVAYLRFADADAKKALLCVHHFGVGYFPHYLLPILPLESCDLLMNTDDTRFGGSGKGFREPEILTPEIARQEREAAGLIEADDESGPDCWGLDIELPPSATLIFSVTLQ